MAKDTKKNGKKVAAAVLANARNESSADERKIEQQGEQQDEHQDEHQDENKVEIRSAEEPMTKASPSSQAGGPQETHTPARSVWQDAAPIAERERLSTDIRTDVCVIGAGIAGLSTAYHLAKQGKAVVVLDDGIIGGGMTGFTTAHLVSALDDRYHELERYHGVDGARLAASSHAAAISSIEKIVREEQIDCDFSRLDGYLFAPPGDKSGEIEREYRAARQAGIVDVEKVDGAPIAGFRTGTALRFPQQGQLHPLKYLDGLAQAIERLGGHIYCNTHATEITGGSQAQVVTEHGSVIKAAAIVVATNAPVNNRLAIHTKQAPYTSYVIAAEVPAGTVTPALYWDTRQDAEQPSGGDAPYHYVRLAKGPTQPGQDQPSVDYLIVGGEDHKSAQANNASDRFHRLEKWARQRWPTLDKVSHRWSGQVMEPIDGLAYIGRNPLDNDNVYIATGDSGNGMTHGAIAGLLLSDLILGHPNPWQALYDPKRMTFRAVSDFIKENMNVAAQYAKGFLGPGEADSETEIRAGEGAIIRRGVKKVAVYRDAKGELHERNASCPHLGCMVAWNGVEKTWDCPCHGSRFSALGEVICGPANSGLAETKEHEMEGHH